ncbi:MAG TPA: nucleotide exchange factor GrpE [Syntrophomonadaceae bacterium]|nr:nucleotide exchange factor GrpE [Syntrophomonadaceae bacterium]
MSCEENSLHNEEQVKVTGEEEAKIKGETESSPEDSEAKDDVQESIEEKLAAKEKELNDLNQRFLRLAADFENYRRRTRQEAAEIRRTANERLLRELLPIIDNYERALEAAKKDLPENMYTGIEIIYRQLCNLLAQEGVEAIESVGKPFDPQYQEAFQRVESSEYPEGTVTAEVQKGYLLQGKVLRPALVIVAKSKETEKENTCCKGANEDE